ncbi:MAG: arginine ABC transporter permease ArtQ, partial [Haemophilus parainfluenzae]|nr:arginine ABC transporter permease ArtQ [Haemophilus parainfluenzae]
MFYDYLTLIGHAALMTLGLAISSLIVGLLLSIIFTALEANKYV